MADVTPRALELRITAAAAEMGEPRPQQIEWVEATLSQAGRAVSDAQVAPDPVDDVAVVVVQAQGRFTWDDLTPQHGDGEPVAPSRGRALVLVLEASSGQLRGMTVSAVPVELAGLGDVQG